MKPIHFISCAFMMLAISNAAAEIKLPTIFSDHMVLQRSATVPLWGWASPNETVTIAVGLARFNTIADGQGNWSVNIKDLVASAQPIEINVVGQNNQVAIHDVLVGDVWLCAGESHMAFPLGQSSGAKDELPKASHPEIRFYVPKFHTSLTPQSDAEGTWQICTPDTAKIFSEVAYYFSREIADQEKVPVGVIGVYGRDTSPQAWVSLDVLNAVPDLKVAYVDPFEQDSKPLDLAELGRNYDLWLASGGSAYQAALKKWSADNAFAQKRKLPSPLKPTSPSAPEPTRPDIPSLPSVLGNALIAPVAPFAIKGVVWYQSESSLGQGTYFSLLSTLISDWRKKWHQDNLPFLFVQAPPHQAKPPQATDNSSWAVLREAQELALKKIPNTGMAAAIDLPYDKASRGVSNTTVAQRLARLARNLSYGENIVAECPIFDSYRIDGNKIDVTFKNVGHGLVVASSPPLLSGQASTSANTIKGFAIAGTDHKFVWANASLEGPDTVSLTADEVPEPVFVRYGWSDAPEVNLANDANLPVCSFRSDEPIIPPSDAALVAQNDDFFSIDKIRYFDQSPTKDLLFFKEVPATNVDGTPGTTNVFAPYLEADVRVKEATKPNYLIARAYFYDRDKKLIASVQQPNAKSIGGARRQYLPVWPAILPKGTVVPLFFAVPDSVLQMSNWSAVVVFGDANGVAAQFLSGGDDFARLDDFAYPGKEPPKKIAANAASGTKERQAAVDPIITHVEPTFNPQQPQITLFMRPPLGVPDISKAKGVLCLSLLANSLESVKRQLQGFEPNEDLSGTLKFAEDHQLIIVCWGSRRLWNPQKNWDALSPDDAWYTDKAFDQVADAWDRGVQYFVKEYKIPPSGYLLWGMCGSGQYACRLALRKPQYFLAVHVHMPGSFDKPTQDGRKILWCLTTGELEAGHSNSLRFYKQCKALGYPIIYKAIVGLGHADSPIAEDLGAKFFEYALSVRDERLKYDASVNDPLAQFQAAQDSPVGPEPWIESFCKPDYVGDIVNQGIFRADQTDMVPASFRTPLPNKVIADAWNK